MKKTAVLTFIFIFVFQFCNKKSEIPSFETEMVYGVKVVHNFRVEPAIEFKELQFSEDLSIGIVEGDENYMFSYPFDVDSDSKGNIYVLDYTDGEFIKKFWGKGQGPGEFQAAYCMFVNRQNELYVKDAGSNRIEQFSQEGEYQKTYKIEMLYYFRPIENNEFIVDHYTFDEDGSNFLCVGKVSFQENKPVPIFSERQYWPARWSDDEFVYDYPYLVRWDINSHDQIYAASAVDYEINVFNSAGSLLFKFKRDFDPVPVEGEELKKISEMQAKISINRGPNPFSAKFVYPAFKYIAIDEEDRVWIERYQPNWRNRANEETIYDIFSSEGIFQFTTKIPGHIYPQLTFKNGHIYALKKDEAGYSRALRIKFTE